MAVSAPAVVWQPTPAQIDRANMTAFRAWLLRERRVTLADDRALYQWSIDDIAGFWSALWDYCGIVGEKGDIAVMNPDTMPGSKEPAARFFPAARLNYAENLLCGLQENTEIVFWGENRVKRRIDAPAIRDVTSRIQQALQGEGVTSNDRVAALLPNLPETLFALLGVSSLGATWSSASPDFGVQGVLDRFGQIAPKILFVVDGYDYNGKWIDCSEKIIALRAALPDISRIVIVPYDGHAVCVSDETIHTLPGVTTWARWLANFAAQPIVYTRVPFDHPQFILFSSGTTGAPKCIVHGAGGTLLQLVKEHRLHCDIKPTDRVFYYTTCGWMMWNWLVTALASGASLLLYDGSPFYPDGNILFDYADVENATLLGVSAKFIDTLHKQHYRPVDTHRLDHLRTITSTGSVLAPESFDYVYDAIKHDVHLASISGGTDIVSCFMLGYPTLPVRRGELQGAGLGLAVDVYNEDGSPAKTGVKGELVCIKPFVSMPVAFWNDPDGTKYRKAYFTRFPGLWHHGDYVEKAASGGFIIHGRSDATLNPGGVRIGTAEIYRQVEQLPEILEAVAVGQHWGDDERVVLAVVLTPDVTLDQALQDRIRRQIKQGASPRHVPAKIIQVNDIPRTKSGKISEIAVRDTINGMSVTNTEALSNPAALDQYRRRAELAE